MASYLNLPRQLSEFAASLIPALVENFRHIEQWAKKHTKASDTLHADTVASGVATGGTMTDNGDGTIDVAAGTCYLRATDDANAELLHHSFPASASLAMTDVDVNFVFVEYNSGTPQVITSLSQSHDGRTKVGLGRAYRQGTTCHIVNAGESVIEVMQRVQSRFVQVDGSIVRASGGAVGGSGTLNVTVTAAVLFGGLTDFTTSSFDSSGADTFDYYYRDGGGGWTRVADQSAVSDTHYDDGTGVLEALLPNKYGAHWVYLCSDSHVEILYGQDTYGTLAAAQEAQPPSTLPDKVLTFSTLVAKVIVLKDGGTFAEVQSAFLTSFTITPTTDHGGLSGLDDAADHTWASLIDGTRAFPGEVAGITPTAAASLARKDYVDTAIDTDVSAHVGAADPHADRAYADALDHDHATPIAAHAAEADPHTVYVLADGTRVFSGEVTIDSGGLKVKNAGLTADEAIVVEKEDIEASYIQWQSVGGGEWGRIGVNANDHLVIEAEQADKDLVLITEDGVEGSHDRIRIYGDGRTSFLDKYGAEWGHVDDDSWRLCYDLTDAIEFYNKTTAGTGAKFDEGGLYLYGADPYTNAHAWLTLDSPAAGGDYDDQTAGISIGEGGKMGAAAGHLVYTGDGYLYLGGGVVTLGDAVPMAYPALRIDYNSAEHAAKGNWTFDNPPDMGHAAHCSVYMSADEPISLNTNEILDWDTEAVDEDGFHEGVTNPSRLTCNGAGLYDVEAQVGWITVSTSGTRRVILKRNGTEIARVSQTGSAGDPTYQQIGRKYVCADGDYFEIEVRTEGVANSVDGGANDSWFEMTRLRAD